VAARAGGKVPLDRQIKVGFCESFNARENSHCAGAVPHHIRDFLTR
jgi:hypothetical protein